jgi:hypothetical protein
LTAEIIEVVTDPTPVIEVVQTTDPNVIEVIETGPIGPSGPSFDTLAFSKVGLLYVPYTSPMKWYLDKDGILDGLTVSVGTAPSLSPLTVDILKNGSTIYPGGVGCPVLGIGSNFATGTVGSTFAAGDNVSVALVGNSQSGATDLVVVVRLKRT